MKNCYSI